MLKFADGKTERFVIFIHPGKDGNPNSQDIQIGDRYFYVDNDGQVSFRKMPSYNLVIV
ncbi:MULTISPECIES: hypothetical protein [Paenibacillus]|uniref:hypothetical protein n=1 Tax=Paenibacillus TaxID=44249 RepID=UPI0015C3A26E|nr:hypothetical protein [Paenibacillus lautus]